MELKRLREKIDALDAKIIELLNERTRHVLEVGKAKAESGESVYAPERESEIYQKIDAQFGDEVLPKDALKSIYREIMSASLALEKPLAIAYLGPEATFTHLASISKFGASVKYEPTSTLNEVFQEVEQKHADYGVIPIENSIEGAVSHSLDMFIDSELKICSEILFEISHMLMSHSPIHDIRRVYSKAEVFGQCRRWLELHLPKAELMETASTTVAAQRASKEQGTAAIGSKLASTLYNLPILEEGIQDFAKNVTRFLVIGRKLPKATGHDKTSLILSVQDRVGALYDMLFPFKKYKINMTKIESRPSKKRAWDYYFYIDFEGHVDQPKVRKMLREIEKETKFLKVLGSFPASSRKEI
ncbi:MAG: prephenate dehydratase [Candidatus Omnitrophota bacterium]